MRWCNAPAAIYKKWYHLHNVRRADYRKSALKVEWIWFYSSFSMVSDEDKWPGIKAHMVLFELQLTSHPKNIVTFQEICDVTMYQFCLAQFMMLYWGLCDGLVIKCFLYWKIDSRHCPFVFLWKPKKEEIRNNPCYIF